MQLFIDGSIFTFQKKGGISRIFQEILPLMCESDKSLEISLMVLGADRDGLPCHERLQVVPSKPWSGPQGILGKILVKAQRYLYLSGRSLSIPMVWYSSYYTLPLKWNGPRVMLVADLIHELFPELFKGPQNDEFRLRKKSCITQADAVICISEATRRDVIDFYKIEPRKAHVALLAVSPVFKPLPDPGQRKFVKPFLLYIGTRVHYKNFDFFIRNSAAWVMEKDMDVVLVGPSLTQEEEQVLDGLGIRARVHLLNGIDDERLCALYNQSAAFIYPSLYEGFGIPLLEAMACGCPVVASDIPSSREIARDVPYYFSPTDGKGFIEALNQCVGNKDPERIRRGKDVSRGYSWQKTAVETLKVLQSVSEGGGA